MALVLKRFTFLFLLVSNPLWAQIEDNFSDGNFTDNPTWGGETSKFVVDNERLRLNDGTTSGDAYLSTASEVSFDATWEFWCRLDFAPSGSNRMRFYLMSTNSDLYGSLDGYFLQIGESGSDDALELYKQEGSSTERILRGTDARFGAELDSFRVRVTRSAALEWELFTQTSADLDFVSEGTTVDSSFRSSSFCGVRCDFTSTRADLFYFDDIVVTGDFDVDETPPTLQNVEVTEDFRVRLTFSEPLDTTDLLTPTLFTVTPASSSALSVSTRNGSASQLEIVFDTLVTGSSYTLSLPPLPDLSGNVLETEVFFNFYFAQEFDVLITEILADPTPTVLLPEAEFVELTNVSDFTINLDGWIFSDASSSAILPSFSLVAGSSVILTDEENTGLFSEFSNVTGVPDFPTLNNTSDALFLYDEDTNFIHNITYSVNWYTSEEKRSGGWSLEMIDPAFPCAGDDNWDGSESDVGGTPTTTNSIAGEISGFTPPRVAYVYPVTADTLLIEFEGYVTESEALSRESYHLTALSSTLQVEDVFREISSYFIVLSEKISSQEDITLSISGISDCAANTIDTSFTIALPGSAEEAQIILNEILFNPYTGGSDFIEIMNLGDQVLNLGDLRFASTDEDGALTQVTPANRDALIFPGLRYVLTEDPEFLLERYEVPYPAQVLEQELPTLPDNEGSIVLLNAEGERLEEFSYSADMHFALIDDVEGVSLERLDKFALTNQSENWQSASQTSGFATPTASNSQQVSDVKEELQRLSPKVITPNGDGVNDFLTITYSFESPGHVLNCLIYNHRGQLIRKLYQNTLLGNAGSLKWDGLTDEGKLANSGIYILHWETFNLNGDISIEKHTVVVGANF